MIDEIKFRNFQDVPVWQAAHHASLKIDEVTKSSPRRELYSLTSQLRRSSFSISANIAEGFYRDTTKDLVRFLYNSRGACGEVLNYLLLALDLKYLKGPDFNELFETYNDIAKQLNNWIKSLKNKKLTTSY